MPRTEPGMWQRLKELSGKKCNFIWRDLVKKLVRNSNYYQPKNKGLEQVGRE